MDACTISVFSTILGGERKTLGAHADPAIRGRMRGAFTILRERAARFLAAGKGAGAVDANIATGVLRVFAGAIGFAVASTPRVRARGRWRRAVRSADPWPAAYELAAITPFGGRARLIVVTNRTAVFERTRVG